MSGNRRARPGQVVVQPDGQLMQVVAHQVTGRPEWVRNQLTAFRNAGTLVHHTGIQSARRGYTLRVLVLEPLNQRPARTRRPWVRPARWVAAGMAVAAALFGIGFTIAWATADTPADVIRFALLVRVALAAGFALVVVLAATLTRTAPPYPFEQEGP